ncbi:hypothetical protein [Bifidobacterium thermophilum]|uniref:hypothetical protein n=1 Tax=Bifidobacterium thermophilum TaxID=33905 RepID=UPI0030B5115C
MMKRIGYALYAASLSVIVLAIAALFLVVENTAVTLIWEVWAVRVPSRWAVAVPVAVAGTLLLVWGKRRWGDIPHTTRDVIGALKRGEAINYHTAWRDLLIALIILAAGAGVGPEASLMGAVIAYSVWQCDKLRYLRTHADSVSATPMPQRLRMLYHPTRWIEPAASTTDAANTAGAADSKRTIRVCAANSLIVIVMFVGMTTMPKFSDQGMDTLDFWRRAWIALPLAAYALAVAGVCVLFRAGIRALSRRVNVPMTVRLLVGGVLVVLVVTILPVLSTSGQHQIHTIGTLFTTLGAGALFALAAGKLLFAQLCIECRWTGGDIFPIMFAALLHGCALAKLLPGCQPVVVVMTVAFCTAIVLVGNAPLAGILMALFFPARLLPLELAVTLLAWGAMRVATAVSAAMKRRRTGRTAAQA